MVIQEKQAKLKICPMLASDPMRKDNLHWRCMGKECMAWRWLDKRLEHPSENDLGYCGIAGEPFPLVAIQVKP